MNVDKVAIGNMALANIGEPPVQNFDQVNAASRALKLRYDEARLECLNAAPWNFASYWRAGVALDIDPKPGWSYVFSYPSDALRVFEILRSSVDERTIPFEVTDRPDAPGKLIHANIEEPVFVYTVDKSVTTDFDWDFISAMAWLLAHKIAMPVTKNSKMRDDAMKAYMMLVDVARARTKNEGVKDNDVTASYQAVR
jgi:hypothetical protein